MLQSLLTEDTLAVSPFLGRTNQIISVIEMTLEIDLTPRKYLALNGG